MKKFLAVVILSLVVVQLCLLPLAVEGTWGGCPSVTTLPATNITCGTATLNGSVTFPGLTRNIKPNGVVLASLQYAGTVRQAYVSFRYGTAPGVYSNETPSVLKTASGDALATVDVLANISGLAPNTTYYVQAKVRSIADASFYQNRNNIQGAGVGLDCTNLQQLYIPDPCTDTYGSVISFQTTGCQVGTGAPTSHGSST